MHDHEKEEQVKAMPLVYVKKWMKTKYAFLFRLSNRIVQVDFTDKTQIILSPSHQIICYKNKKGESSQHSLETALDVDFPEMVKRLKYTKEILAFVKNGSQKSRNQSENHAKLDTDVFEQRLETVHNPTTFRGNIYSENLFKIYKRCCKREVLLNWIQ